MAKTVSAILILILIDIPVSIKKEFFKKALNRKRIVFPQAFLINVYKQVHFIKKTFFSHHIDDIWHAFRQTVFLA